MPEKSRIFLFTGGNKFLLTRIGLFHFPNMVYNLNTYSLPVFDVCIDSERSWLNGVFSPLGFIIGDNYLIGRVGPE